MSLRIRLLGPFAVELDGAVLPASAWRRRRPVDLLQTVALSPGGALHRDQLVDTLWPDKDTASGANNFHRALHDLRAVVGEAHVPLDKGVVRLAKGTWIDVAAFEGAIVAGDLPAALALYRGDLCSDDPYPSRLAERREALQRRCVDAAYRLARHHLARTQDGEASAVLGRLLEIDPVQEEAHRLLVQLFARSGRREDALRQYDTCVRVLRERLDVSPSAATQRLREGLRRSDATAAPAPRREPFERLARRIVGTGQPGPLRGRAGAVSTIADLVAGRRGSLVLLGEAGVGKSRLAVEAARLALEAGAVVLAGGGVDLGEPAPYLPFIEAVAAHLRATGRPTTDSPFASFVPTPGGAPQDDKLRLFQSVERFLAELAEDGFVTLLIEDLHLADESSLHLHHYLARATRWLPLAIVATCREEEIGVGTATHLLLAALHRERLGARLLVDRLDRGSTAALVADLMDEEPDAELVRTVYGLTSGNAFYVEEVVRAALEQGAPAVPRDLAETVLARIQRLGDTAERLLVAASVLGQRFAFATARELADLDVAPALAALEQAIAARVVEEDDTGCRFHHALVRGTLYRSSTRSRRVELHRRAASLLATALAAHPEQLAYHHLAADEPHLALPHLVAAGRQAVNRAGLEEAVAFFEEARRVMDRLGVPSCPDRYGLLLGLGQLRIALSDLTGAVRELDAAAALSGGWCPSQGQRATALRWATLACITSGDLAGADRRIAEALAGLPSDDPERPEVLYHLAQVRWHEGRHDEAHAVAERCLGLAQRGGAPDTIARAYEMLALCCHALGDWRRGIGFEDQRRAVAGATVDVAQVFDVHL